jgi:hypothetical protein
LQKQIRVGEKMNTDKNRKNDRKEEEGPKNDHVPDAIDAVNTIPYRVNGITDCSLSDEAVLHSPESERALSLNSSAKAIWGLCDGSRTIVEISQELGKRFGCPGTDLLSDVITAISEFKKYSFLELKNVTDSK